MYTLPLTQRQTWFQEEDQIQRFRFQEHGIIMFKAPGREGKTVLPLIEQFVAFKLAQGEYVHWIDGACRIDPSRLIPFLKSMNAPIEASLSRLFLSRGFTLHQLHAQLERLPSELAITQSTTVIIEGMLCMHEDPQINPCESRALFRRQCQLLKMMIHQQPTQLMMVLGSSRNNYRHPEFITQLERLSKTMIQGYWKGRGKNRQLWLLHKEINIHQEFSAIIQLNNLHYSANLQNRPTSSGFTLEHHAKMNSVPVCETLYRDSYLET